MAEENKDETTAETTASAGEAPKAKKRAVINLSKGSLIWTIWHFAEVALLIVGGILAIIYSKEESVQNVIYPVVGAFLILGGFLKILTNFLPVVATSREEAALKLQAKKEMAYDMVIGGAFELALGITLCVIYGAQQSAIPTITLFLSTFIAIILMVAGISLLLFAIGFIVSKLYKLYMPILEIIFGLALIALGIVVVIYMNKPEVFNQVVLIIVGLVLVLSGLGMLVTTITTLLELNAKKKMAKAADGEGAASTSETPVQEVDLSTEEGKAAAPEENKPNDDKK
jgi:cytochrome c biogenesis protein CcdA